MHMTRNSYPFLFLDNSSIKDKGACVFFMRDNCFKTPTFIVEPKSLAGRKTFKARNRKITFPHQKTSAENASRR
ncbi:hypothetical protein, partial [Alteribacillus sp. HJP-4]|uniref:hypothetical protein n=1 Tax=Alteribacillus sp. HJP-4 TaxID=2775394 RepID=UPI0035CCF080